MYQITTIYLVKTENPVCYDEIHQSKFRNPCVEFVSVGGYYRLQKHFYAWYWIKKKELSKGNIKSWYLQIIKAFWSKKIINYWNSLLNIAIYLHLYRRKPGFFFSQKQVLPDINPSFINQGKNFIRIYHVTNRV